MGQSIRYVSPEMLNNVEVGCCSDLWAIACCVYCFFAGRALSALYWSAEYPERVLCSYPVRLLRLLPLHCHTCHAVQCSALCHQHCRCTATATATSLHALALPLLSDSLAHWTAARSTRRSKRRPSFGCSRRSSRSTSHSPARSPTSRATSPPKWYGPVT